MASKASHQKKHITKVAVCRLSKENDFLKMLVHHCSTLNELLESFLTIETLRLEGSQQLEAKNKNALPTEQLCEAEDNQMDGVSRIRRITPNYSEIEELKNKLVSLPARCQQLGDKFAKNKSSTSDDQALTDDIRTLQNNLKDALEKNKQWLEYDQLREAYVRAILARMLWLEKQLNEASQACLQQHNEDHSDEKAEIIQMQELYTSLLREANNELEVLRCYFGETSQELIRIQNNFKEREEELEEYRQQQQALKTIREGEIDVQSCSDEEEQERAEELRRRLDEEKGKSADVEQDILESVFIDTHKANQQKIADLERQVRIISEDLEDSRQDCLYLKKKIVKLLKKQSNSRGQHPSKEQQDCGAYGAAFPTSPLSEDGLQSSANNSLLSTDESCLECSL
ncbi:centrosomal protein of 55 kDa-like isoform X2 [Halichoeres trimaculatus]|uniref:centrosomal protein of 55 kDa-like isoform X2 n=1 Tax=Halichoeres trimaculatus TaxID=147232 RepID=UPI003D9F2B29